MSESDSDLCFESADEDAEFAPSIKSKGSQKSTLNELSESFSTEGNASAGLNMSPKQLSPSDEKEISEDSQRLRSNDKSQYSEVSKKTDNSSNLKKNFENLEGTEFDQKIGRVSKTDDSSDLKEDLKNAEGTEFGQKIARVLKTDNSSDLKEDFENAEGTEFDQKISSAKSVSQPKAPTEICLSEFQSEKPDQQTEESKNRKERVVLRLEKKKLSKESSVESEKPSDFVNILQGLNEKQQSSAWGFSSWGSSFLSSAASSVSTFSNQISQGIGSVLETVESTLGAPPAEELAQTLNEKKAEPKELVDVEEEKDSDVLPGVSAWAKVLENTGSKVIMGGLDTLELIGKKTMDILTEGDPGLRKKRSAFSGGSNLSELLREIKAQADEQSKDNSEVDADDVHYSQIFDEKQGLVHLEALEMLSKQSQAKFQRLLLRHSKHSEIKKRLNEIKSICENIPSLEDYSDCGNFEDFEAVFKKYTLELNFSLNAENIIKTQRNISETITNYENASEDTKSLPKEIFQSSICSLADFTAKCIETFHKAAELILVQPNFDPDLEHCATILTGLTTVMCIEVNNLASRYHKCLEKTAECLQEKGIYENADVKILATNIYVEASNSNNYIQDAYQMLVPVMQARFLEAVD